MAGSSLMLIYKQEYHFQVKGLTLKAKSWGDPTQLPVLALHGWLDNCHSFLPLTEHLEGIYLVSIDLAGHGQSDHRSLDSGYNIWQDVADVFEIADALGFDHFALLGHSRGAYIATIASGTFPGRIKGLALLDGFASPEYALPAEAPQQLAKAIKTSKRLAVHKRKLHPDIYRAVKERSTGENEMSETAAMVLAERGMRSVAGGVVWSSDPRLQAASDFKLTKQHCQGFIDQIICPVLLILATTGFSAILEQAFDDLTGHRVASENNFKKITVPGNHHMHMEKATVQQIAHTLNVFFLNIN